jgi:tetratricopeptide (TPR) repeat protein
MNKACLYIILIVLVGGSWMLFTVSGGKLDKLEAQIEETQNMGDPEDEMAMLKTEFQSMEGQRTFNGILLAFLSAGLVGIFFVLEILPAIAHRMTHAVYDSAEMVEEDPMHDARSLLAQGDYHGAIEAFRTASAADPLNRLPWVEIAKIQKTNLEDPMAAITTIRGALESQEWELNDAAYFLFRLAELYDEDAHDRNSAVKILQQVIDEFPETRHSANARHRLHEWGLV